LHYTEKLMAFAELHSSSSINLKFAIAPIEICSETFQSL
jgi:hypothetical protein